MKKLKKHNKWNYNSCLEPRRAHFFSLAVLFIGLFLVNFASAIDWTNNTLISYYKFDGNLSDSISTGKNLTNFGAFNDTAKLGSYSLNFSGGKYANRTIGNIPIGTNAITECMWVMPGTTVNHQYTWHGEVSPSHPASDGSMFGVGTNGQKFHLIGYYNDVTGTTTYSLGTWYFVCAVQEGANSRKLYVNGLNEGNGTDTYNIVSSDFYIGENLQNPQDNPGRLDELSIWNRSLSQSEILELYNNGNGLTYNSEIFNININLVYPENDDILSTDGTFFNSTLNITGSNPNGYEWKNATVYIWYTNGTLFTSNYTTLSGNNTVASIFVNDFSLGKNYLWGILGYYGNITYSNYTWSQNNFTFTNLPFNESSYSYTTSVFETSGQTFNLLISTNPQVSSITSTFHYEGNSYSTTLQSIASGTYNASNYIDIPLQQSSGNKSFYWNFIFTLEDGTIINSNSTIFSQEVNRTYLVNCNSTYNTQFINFTAKSAENPFPKVNAIFKSAWRWYLSSGSGTVYRNYTFEDMSEGNSSWAFCGLPNLTFVTNANIEYDRVDYSLNFYYLDEASLSNSTEYINLYLLNSSKATTTILKVVDSAQDPIEDVTIQIQFYDVGTDSFYLVGMGKTDFKGEDVAYLNWYDTLYKFVLIKDGQVIKTTNTTKISDSTVTFNILESEEFLYKKFRDFVYSLYFNNATNNFVLTFTKPSGLVDQGCLRVIKRTAANDTVICFTCESSSSATLYCNIGSAGNGTFIAHFYATGSYYDLDWIVETIGESFSDQIYQLLGASDASFYAFIFAGIVTFMFFIHPIFGIIGAILGVLGANILGFAPLDYGIFTGIILIGIIIIWIIKR